MESHSLLLFICDEAKVESLTIDHVRVFGFPLRSSVRHAKHSGEEAVGGVGVVGDAQKGWALQPLCDSLVPFDHRILDSIGLEKTENVRGSTIPWRWW